MDTRKKYSFLLLIGIAVLAVGGVGSAHYLGRQAGYKTGFETGFKKAVQQQTVDRYRFAVSNDPVSLGVNIDEVLGGLVERGENTPNQRFQGSVNQINRSLLTALVNRYGLSDPEKEAAFREYDVLSQSDVTFYFEELQALKKSRVSLPSQTFISLEAYEVANDFSVLLADRACSLVSLVIGFSSLSSQSNLMLSGSCKFVAEQLLAPLAQAMKERGLVVDINKSQYQISEHTRSAIAELAVAEDRLTETFVRNFTRTMLKDTWLEFNSTATFTVHADGSIKAGFALQDYYNVRIDDLAKIVYVTLPKAKVLSRDISFEILQDENGFFVNVTTEKRNQAFSSLRQQLENTALQRGLLKVAEGRAAKLIQVLYSPITYLPGSRYRVEVQFEEEH